MSYIDANANVLCHMPMSMSYVSAYVLCPCQCPMPIPMSYAISPVLFSMPILMFNACVLCLCQCPMSYANICAALTDTTLSPGLGARQGLGRMPSALELLGAIPGTKLTA
jgi:hypothetical protein